MILDNVPAHKVEGAAPLIGQSGVRLLYLPSYCPDLNPIEMAGSSIKHFLRKAQARTQEALYEALATSLNTLTPDQAKAYFSHAEIRV